jgi:uncharacterized membrane protein
MAKKLSQFWTSRAAAESVALTAVMTAVTTVATMLIRVPIPATTGYFNFCDVLVYFAAFAFGPWVGLVAGGVGPAVADLMGGYGSFAPLTLLAHGLQGFAAGWLGRKGSPVGVLLGWLGGTLAMVGLYYVGEATLYGYGWKGALGEVLPNLGQNLGGGLIGIPLYYAVRKAYPPILRLGKPRTWQEK